MPNETDFDWDEGRDLGDSTDLRDTVPNQPDPSVTVGLTWRVLRRGIESGPLSQADVRTLLRSQQMRADDLVWYPGLDSWQRADQVPLLSDLFIELKSSRFSSKHPWLLRIGVAVGVLAVLISIFLSVQSFISSGITRGPDQQFGDQHLKTVVALVELHKVRNGTYPERLKDLEFTGPWDELPLQVARYIMSDDGQHYYVEVTRGWVGKPELSFPDEFWRGTGYDPTLAEDGR